MEIVALEIDKYHIHLLCGGHQKISLGQIVRIFKSISAREIFKGKPTVKKELWGREFCTDAYYVATVGEKANWGTVEKYIQKQGRPREELKQLQLW